MREAVYPHHYRIRVQGQLDPSWTDHLGEVDVSWDTHGGTVLTATRLDQAALHGLLSRLYELGIPLLSVSCLDLD
jgi:hypothetical protein